MTSLSIQIVFQALGYTLVHFCWLGAVIAGLYALTLSAAPRMRPATRYVLGLAALLAMLGAAAATFGYEVSRLASSPAGPAAFDSIAPAYHVWDLGQVLAKWLPLLDIIWLMGVIALSARMAAGLWHIRSLAQAADAVPAVIMSRFEAALRRTGLSGKVRVRLNASIDGPFVVGIVRAVVYLPISAVSALSPEQLDTVFAHELEHVRRADYAWNLLQSVIETLFFYHPAVWWLGKALREQRELCCDDAALNLCRDPLVYATALLNLEEQRRKSAMAGNLVMALNGHGSGAGLLSRIKRILGETQTKTNSTRRALTPTMAPLILPVALVAAAVFALPIGRVAASPNATTTHIAPTSQAIHAANIDDDAPAVAETPAPQATDADVAPGEDSWSFIRDAAQTQSHNQARNEQWQKEADKGPAIVSDVDISELQTLARNQALEAVQLHRADIERAAEDAKRALADIKLRAMSETERAKLEALVRQSVENAKAAQAQIELSQADINEIKAEAARAADEAKASITVWKREWKTGSGHWTKQWNDGSVPPSPPAPPAPPAPNVPPAPPSPPTPVPPATPAAPEPEARPVVEIFPVTAVKPITASVQVISSDDGKTLTVICKKTVTKTVRQG